MAPPRIFGLPASAAPVVAVLRRGPSAWFHVGRWDVATPAYEPGAWIKANIYPQRADLSPDGRWLAYLTAKGPGTWRAGTTYVAVARLPWVHALAAWGTCGTWSRGVHFVARADHRVEPPDEGTVEPLRRRFGLAVNPAVTFAVERRNGWTEADGTLPRDAERDPWDERRAEHVVMEKRQPGGDAWLTVRGVYAAFREGPFRGRPRDVHYAVSRGGAAHALADVQWADWDAGGRLLVATSDGVLQIRTVDAGDGGVVWEHSLAELVPDPRPAPAWARRWDGP